MSYNDANSHPRDRRVTFEPDEHIYIVDGTLRCDSVTTVIADYFEKFDADYWAERKATPLCSAEMLKAEWRAKADEASRLGTEMHARIEKYWLGDTQDEAACADGAFRRFLQFAKDHSLTPYRTEWALFSEEYRIAGTLDFLGYSDGSFEMYDWKRSKKVVDSDGMPVISNFGRTGRYPLSHVPDTSFHHYALQQSMYRYLLATKYGIDVDRCSLGIFHPDIPGYHVVEVPYLLEEVKAILRQRQ